MKKREGMEYTIHGDHIEYAAISNTIKNKARKDIMRKRNVDET